ncbi:MAG: acyl-CoA/acyl-ACP dehydrogenase [Proteobacteria bacterium]|nr:acyl-CoA/acyl-ACP dehydrogenase [Pseudomonadota bacterium]
MQLEPTTAGGRRFVEIAEAHIEAFRARAAEHDRAGSFPSENFDDLRKSGAVGAFVPEDLGGLGLESVQDWSTGIERIARGDPSTAIALNMHLAVSRNVAQSLRGAQARGDAEAIARGEGMLGAVASGQLLICATATEPGTDFLRPNTTATPTADGWSISGRKIFVTMSPVANLYALNVRAPDPEGGPDRMGFAFVPVGTPGVVPQDDWDALGMRASGSQSIVLEDCRVPTGSVQLVGTWGEWNPGVLMGRTLGNVSLIGAFLGIAERARELAVAGARKTTKPKYDGAIAGASGVQHLLGEIDIALAAARASLRDATAAIDTLLAHNPEPDLETAHGCMRDYQCAKWTVNQNAIGIVSRAMDVCGGGAFMSGHELSRLYRDVRAGPFMQPFSPTEAREYVGRIALGLPPKG